MKKPLVILLSTIGITSAAFAIPVSSFNGFYAGAAVGGTFTQADISGATNALYNNLVATIENNTYSLPSALDTNSVGENIHLGYGHQLGQSPLYLGAEVFGDFADREMNSTQTSVNITNFLGAMFAPPVSNLVTNNIATTTNVKLNTAEFGVDLHPGILFGQNTLLSAIVGVAFNKLQISSNNMQLVAYNSVPFGLPPLPILSTALQASTSKNVAALRLGGELQEHFNNHWALTADYIYTDYGKISTSTMGNINVSDNKGNVIVLPNAFTTNASANVSSNTVTLGMNYYFSANQEAATNLSSAAFTSSPFNGFYAGAAVGGAFTQADLSGTTNDQFFTPLPDSENNTNPLLSDLHKNSILGDIHLGYGHQLGQSPLYLGAEVFGDFANREMSNTQTNIVTDNSVVSFPPLKILNVATDNIATTTNVKLNTAEFGVDLHPGVLLGRNTLLSGIVGVAFNKLQISSNNMQVTTYNPALFTSPTIASALRAAASKNVAALRLGGEVQEHFNNHWALTADYVYTDYGKISASAAGNVDYSAANIFGPTQPGTIVLPFSTNVSANVHSNSVLLGLNYYFSGSQQAT